MNKIYYEKDMGRFRHNISILNWKYPNILGVRYFLRDFEIYLNLKNISETIHKLEKYINDSKQGALTLHFQEITLEVMGIDEVFKTLDALESFKSELK